MADIGSIVSVSTSIVSSGVLSRDFGRTLFITNDSTLASEGANRVRAYPSLRALAEDFPVNSEPYKAASVYFAQSPPPKPFVVARWPMADAAGRFVGAKSSKSAAAFLQSIKDANGETMTVLGTTTSAATFTNADSLSDIAAILQSLIQSTTNSNLAAATVTYSNKQFVISVPYAAGITWTAPTGPLADAVLLSESTGGQVYEGGTAESTVEEAMNDIENVSNNFSFITLQPDLETTDTVLALASWVEPRQYMYSAGTSDAATLTPNETGSVGAQLNALSRRKTFVTWTREANYAAVAAAGVASSVNFAGSNTVKTLKFKRLGGVKADDLTPAQIEELQRKRINFYTSYGGLPAYAEGFTSAPGVWADVQQFLIWFQSEVQTQVFNLLQASARVPQTVSGIATLRAVIDGVCLQAVTNGAIAPGEVSDATRADIAAVIRQPDFDGSLSRGFLIHIGSLADQPANARTERRAPPIRIFLKSSGAFHFVDIDISFEN